SGYINEKFNPRKFSLVLGLKKSQETLWSPAAALFCSPSRCLAVSALLSGRSTAESFWDRSDNSRCEPDLRQRTACYRRLAARFLSYTASIGPSDKMLPRRLSEGAYKLEALPPSRNRALGQFSPSRNRRAKASNDTSP